MASAREKFKFVSTATIDGKPTGVYYTYTISKKKEGGGIKEMTKFDKRVRKHVKFKRAKIK